VSGSGSGVTTRDVQTEASSTRRHGSIIRRKGGQEGGHDAPSASPNSRRTAWLSEADVRIRTADPFITSEVLYQLSYVGVVEGYRACSGRSQLAA
jgi:hypothetical protein